MNLQMIDTDGSETDISIPELRDAIRRGKVTRVTLVRSDPIEEFIPAEKHAAFLDFFPTVESRTSESLIWPDARVPITGGALTSAELTAYLEGDQLPEGFGRNEYYMDNWASILHGRGRLAGFNVGAAFLFLPWAFYRRMYIAGIIVVLVAGPISNILLAGGAKLFGEGHPLAAMLTVGILTTIALGVLGNILYLRQAVWDISKARKTYVNQQSLILGAVRKRGGTSTIGATVGVLIFFLQQIVWTMKLT